MDALARGVAQMLRSLPDAKALVFGTQRTHGALDVADVVLFEEAGVVGVTQEFRFATGAVTGIAKHSTVTVDGTDYKVMMPPQRQKDGTTLLALGDT